MACPTSIYSVGKEGPLNKKPIRIAAAELMTPLEAGVILHDLDAGCPDCRIIGD